MIVLQHTLVILQYTLLNQVLVLSEIGNSAHTHTLSEITDFNAYSGSGTNTIRW